MALLTFFDADGRLLPEDTAGFAAALAERGAAAVLVAGTTGEFAALSDDERLALLRATRAAVPASVPVIAGIGAHDAAQAVALAAAVGEAGADGALCFVPAGEEPAEFYRRVRAALGDLPLLGYHFPQAGFAPLDVTSLADLPLDGIKDSSGQPDRLWTTRQALAAGTYTGSALLVTLAAALELSGALLALGNLEPALAQAAWHGDLSAQGRLAALHASLAGEPPPRVLKRLVAERFSTPPWTRSRLLDRTG